MSLFNVGSCRRRKIQSLGLILLIVLIYYFLQFFSLSRLGGAFQNKGHKYEGVNVKHKEANGGEGKKSDKQPQTLSKNGKTGDGHVAGGTRAEEERSAPRGVHPSAAAFYIQDSKSNGTFKCLESEIRIPMDLVNDDFCDCPDSSDEPGTSACPNGRFYCRVQLPRREPQFVTSSKVNDGICDCCDGSDEWQGRLVPPPVSLNGKRGAVLHAPCVDQCGDVLKQLELEQNVRRQGLLLQRSYLEAARDLSPRLQHKFGPLGIFYTLSKDCYTHPSHQYLYTVCPFEEVRQTSGPSRTVLGRRGHWTLQTPGHHVLLMAAGDSALCPDGNSRQTEVHFVCGLEDRVVSVDEEQKCHYKVTFSTPAAC